jgi:hypothetical protein
MQYYSILSSIPNHIKKHIRENLTDCFNTFNPEDIFLERIINNKDIKFVYFSLVNSIVHIPMQKFLKWEEKLQCDIPNWFIYFNILRKCSKNVYLINFQYKFLHRVIPTNTFLFKIHVKDSKSCSFCNVEDETIEHLFFDCPCTYQFWRVFFECLKRYFNNIELKKKLFYLDFKHFRITYC